MARALAVTDCLNFGSPENPQIMWQFKECVRGISEACRVFDTPVTGGNVSFYNESPRGPIDPTPVIGMLGLIESGPLTMGFKDEGDRIVLLGETHEELGGSEYLKQIHRRKQGRPPTVDLAAERRLIKLLLEANRQGLLKSAHDCAEGGLAVAVAECCIADADRMLGATVSLIDGGRRAVAGKSRSPIRADVALFAESAGRVIVSCESYQIAALLKLARQAGVPAALLGEVGGKLLVIHPWIEAPIKELNRAWRGALAPSAASVA